MVEINLEKYNNIFHSKERKPNVYLIIKEGIIKIHQLTNIADKNKEKIDGEIFITATKYIVKEGVPIFRKLMGEILQTYYDWIDSHQLKFRTDKFFSLCQKAYKEALIPFYKFYRAYSILQRKTPRAYGLILDETRTKVLLVKNSVIDDHKKVNVGWSLPGGKVEDGESFEHCLRREFREELSLCVKEDELVEQKEFFNFQRRMMIFLLILPEQQGLECISTNPYEIEEIHWFPIDDLPTLTCVSAHALHIYDLNHQCTCDICLEE